jgi:hypothetical protein
MFLKWLLPSDLQEGIPADVCVAVMESGDVLLEDVSTTISMSLVSTEGVIFGQKCKWAIFKRLAWAQESCRGWICQEEEQKFPQRISVGSRFSLWKDDKCRAREKRRRLKEPWHKLVLAKQVYRDVN